MENLTAKQRLPHIQILTGVHRCGKSSIFKLLMNDLMKSDVDAKAILNINLDAPAFIPVWNDASQIDHIVDVAERLTTVRPKYLFLDEVQQIKDWEVYVKAAYDSRLFSKIYITGSNSNLLQSRFASMLSGRYFANEVRPFSIVECLAVRGVQSLLDAYQQQAVVDKCLSEALHYGTFPEIVLSNISDCVKRELLQSYFESIVQKDCVIYNSIRDAHLFYRMVYYTLQNAGNRFSPQQLAKSLASNENTIAAYINYLCDSYICTDIRNFSFSQKETKRSDHKCYCIDNGLISANTSQLSPNNGRLFENLVFNELVNKGYTRIAFDNSKGECDFLAMKNGEAHAFQACYELTDANVKRELSGFNVPNVPLASKTIITYNQKRQEGDVRIIPLWEWALS